MYKYSIPASQRTQSVPMIKADQVMLLTEIIGVEFENHMNRKIYCVAKCWVLKC
jgi:hypothetical protein